MYNFKTLVIQLNNMGIWTLLAPFLLTFVLIYAILQKTEVLGKSVKKLNSVMAIVMAGSLIFAHLKGIFPNGADPIIIINKFMPSTGAFLIGIFGLYLMMGGIGFKYSPYKSDFLSKIFTWGPFIVMLIIIADAINLVNLPFIRSIIGDGLWFIVGIIIFGFVLKMIVGPDGKTIELEKDKEAEDYVKDLYESDKDNKQTEIGKMVKAWKENYEGSTGKEFKDSGLDEKMKKSVIKSFLKKNNFINKKE